MFMLMMVVSTVAYLWMCFVIAKRSIPGAILTFLFVLPAIYFLATGWGEDEHDIRTPFFAMVGSFALAIVMIAKSPQLQEEIERESRRSSAPVSSLRAPA